MYRTMLLTAVLVFAAGCPDQSAAKRAQSARKLDQAMEQMRQAGVGYVPADVVKAQSDEPISVSEFRQRKLHDTVEGLKAAAEVGSPSQRMSARRLIADVHSSGARHQTRQGSVEAAALANRAAALFSHLVAVDRADARAASFNTDLSAVLQTLETELNDATAARHEIQAKLDELKPQVQTLQDQIQDLRRKSTSLRGDAQTMRREGFDLEGEARYDRLDQADRVQLAADNSEFEAQRLTVDLQKLQSIQQDHERSLAAADQKVQMITQVRAQTMQRQADATKLREEALSDRAAATGILMTQFNEVAQAYETTVVAAFERAMAEQAQAIEQLDLAVGDAADAAGGTTRQDREVVQADLVGKLLDRVYVLSEYASVAGEFGRSLDALLVRADTLMPEHASAIAQVRRQVQENQARLLNDANETSQRARDLIGQLRQSAPDGSDMAAGLLRQQQALDGYSRQRQNATLDQRA